MPLRWASWLRPRLDWIQVEVSTHCPAACLYCPHTLYRPVWQHRHMSLDDFRRLAAAFAKTEMIYLQGWGEPLTHPEFFEMVRLAKAAGCRVGLTTNGMLLDEEKCLRLVQEGVDIVAFSLAGVDEENDAIRQGTHFRQVVAAIQTLVRMKKLLGSARPDVHLAYLMLRSRRQEVEGLPVLLQRLNVKNAVISTLDFIGDRVLLAEAILPATEGAYRDLRSQLEATAEACRRNGSRVDYWLAAPGGHAKDEPTGMQTSMVDLPFLAFQPQTCTENIHRSAFVSADGAVSPCVYTNVPVTGASHIVAGAERPYRRTIFGNIHDAPFEAIWRSKAYSAFRTAHRAGSLPELCLGCPRARMV